MKNSIKKFSVVLLLLVLFGCSEFSETQAMVVKASTKPPVNSAISRAVQKYSDRESPGLGKITIFKSDVQGAWALVWGRAAKKDVDDAQYLLHKEKGVWKVLVMGTALVGTGAEYKVPPALSKKWNL